jgi:hypothetical protein
MTQNMITDVLPAWQGTPHFSRHTTEYLNEQIPDWWTCHGGLHNWLLQSLDLTPLDYWVTWKMVYKCKVNRREEFFMPQDAWMTPMFYVRFKSSWISNICSSLTIENWTYVHVIFLTGNDLRNKLLMYWHKVTGHRIRESCRNRTGF